MTGEPVSSSALLLMAASTVSTAGGLYASSKQEKLDRAINSAETERARLAGAETSLTAARDFRSALSSQLAIASLRGGAGGGLMAQFGARSISNFVADQRALESQSRFIETKGAIRNAEIRSQRVGRDIQSVGSLLKAASGAININDMSKSVK